MEKDRRTLANFASMNLTGRLLFLWVPVAVAALTHTAVLALGTPADLAPMAGCITALFAMVAAAWAWLDEPMAIAMERTFGRGIFIAAVMMIPAMLLGLPNVGMAFVAVALASFGALGGTARLTAYSSEPEPPHGSAAIAWTAWATWATALVGILSTTILAVAVAGTTVLGIIIAGVVLLGEKPLTATGSSDLG